MTLLGRHSLSTTCMMDSFNLSTYRCLSQDLTGTAVFVGDQHLLVMSYAISVLPFAEELCTLLIVAAFAYPRIVIIVHANVYAI